MIIRHATTADIAVLAAVEAACFPPAEAATESAFMERVRYSGNHFWLLFDGDRLISFVDGFVTASLTVCIGAMAIVGSIQDGLLGDWSTLALKGALDCIIVCTMTASLGRGCIFSALPVAVFQGTITLFAGALSPIMTTAALDSLSLVGSMLIFCVGVNLIRPQTFRTANMLPSVVIAVIYALLF